MLGVLNGAANIQVLDAVGIPPGGQAVKLAGDVVAVRVAHHIGNGLQPVAVAQPHALPIFQHLVRQHRRFPLRYCKVLGLDGDRPVHHMNVGQHGTGVVFVVQDNLNGEVLAYFQYIKRYLVVGTGLIDFLQIRADITAGIHIPHSEAGGIGELVAFRPTFALGNGNQVSASQSCTGIAHVRAVGVIDDEKIGNVHFVPLQVHKSGGESFSFRRDQHGKHAVHAVGHTVRLQRARSLALVIQRLRTAKDRAVQVKLHLSRRGTPLRIQHLHRCRDVFTHVEGILAQGQMKAAIPFVLHAIHCVGLAVTIAKAVGQAQLAAHVLRRGCVRDGGFAGNVRPHAVGALPLPFPHQAACLLIGYIDERRLEDRPRRRHFIGQGNGPNKVFLLYDVDFYGYRAYHYFRNEIVIVYCPVYALR